MTEHSKLLVEPVPHTPIFKKVNIKSARMDRDYETPNESFIDNFKA